MLGYEVVVGTRYDAPHPRKKIIEDGTHRKESTVAGMISIYCGPIAVSAEREAEIGYEPDRLEGTPVS